MLSKLFCALSLLSLVIATLYTALDKQKISLPYMQNKWNAFAGVVLSYTQQNLVEISVSSGSNANYAIDGNENTFWQSDAPLPNAYFKRPDLNIFQPQNNILVKKQTDYYITQTTDSNLDSGEKINDSLAENKAVFSFKTPQNISLIGLKCGLDNETDTLAIYYINTINKKRTLVGYYDAKMHNYEWQNFFVIIPNCAQVSLECNHPFMIFEIAASPTLPTEYLTFDLGVDRNIGQVWIRGESATNKVQVAVSQDNTTWKMVSDWTAFAGGKMTGIVVSEVPLARYVRIYCLMDTQNWAKASIREVAIYDQDGPYGAPPAPQIGRYTLQQSLGVNGIWGWGHGRYSDENASQEGASLFGYWLSNARNYHELNWDCTDPDHIPNYTAMSAGHGTEAQPWLNWDREYVAWQAAGLQTLVSIKFSNATQNVLQWDNPYQSAYNYGSAFAAHFGPHKGNQTVTAVDIGNEPWDYSPDFYRTVLQGMTDGMRSIDPELSILPCALQAAFPNFEESDFKNFAGVRLNPAIVKNLNAYNCHHYSYAAQSTDGQLRAVHPEHPLSSFRALHNDLRFVASNMPHLPVYVSEWGWDSNGGGNNDCNFAECVSENAQAAYSIRAALYMMRLGVAKFYWYFYANSNEHASLYSRSGLLGSKEKGFLPKMSFKALKALQYHLGDKRFLKILAENKDGYAYLLGTNAQHPTHIVAWLPDSYDISPNKTQNIVLSIDKPIKKAIYLSGHTDKGEPAPIPTLRVDKRLNVLASCVPILLELE